MLSAVSLLLDPAKAEAFFQPPTVFQVVDMVITTGIIYAVWKLYNREREGSVTRTQYEKLGTRLLTMEHTQAAMSQRLDAIGHAAVESEKRREENWILLRDTSQAQLEAINRLKSVVEKGNARVNYVAKTLDERPCVMNETNNGDEKCPEGL